MPTSTQKLTHLVVGLGEVGKAMRTVLTEGGATADGIDTDTADMPHGPKYDVLHVCFPCRTAAMFTHAVDDYRQKRLKEGGLIIVHSTVPVGTTREIGPDAVHSPVRGVHPNLVGGLRTFVKFVGGPRAQEAAETLGTVGITCRATPDSRNTEALKLLDTTYYGWQIMFEKSAHAYCKRLGLDFDLVYGDANRTYNAGYATLGMGHVVRPVLNHMPGKIGGHCVVPNAKLIKDWLGDMVLAFDDQLPMAHTENK